MPRFQMIIDEMTAENRNRYVTPDKVLQSLDSDFESFFFRRQYTEYNFSFYIQVLA